jgi:hypothetical protein
MPFIPFYPEKAAHIFRIYTQALVMTLSSYYSAFLNEEAKAPSTKNMAITPGKKP